MSKPKSMTLDQIFDDAINQAGDGLSSGDLRLLTSGLMALRAAEKQGVNNIELRALSGMIAYVAYNQEVDETTVCEILTAHYGIAEVKALPAQLYQNAIGYLVDLEMKKIVN